MPHYRLAFKISNLKDVVYKGQKEVVLGIEKKNEHMNLG